MFIFKKTKTMNKKLYKFSAFTLVEVIISLVLFSLLSVSTISIYNNVLNSRIDVQSKQVLIENSNKVVDLINIFADEYTIDYEEYFNRAQVGCSNWTSWFWDVSSSSGYCSNFTAYWNESDDWYVGWVLDHRLYVCSRDETRSDPTKYPYIYNLTFWDWCIQAGKQSFWEYYWQFWDVHTWGINDDNDEFIATGPTAIIDNDEVQELYLISKDNTQRLFFRRKCHWDSNLLLSGGVFQDLCSIQILKLRWFDAWTKHDFDNNVNNFGIYDGVIDTWACDYAEWFDCGWQPVWWEYDDFHLPTSVEDGWEDLTNPGEASILDWNLEIYPKKSPWFSLAETGNLIPPFFILRLQSQLNVDKWQQILSSVEKSDLFLQNIFFMKKDVYENDVYNPCEQVVGREKLICPVDFSVICTDCDSVVWSNIITLPKYANELPVTINLDFSWGSGYWYDTLSLVWPNDTNVLLLDDDWSHSESLYLDTDSFWSYKYYLRLDKDVSIPEFCKDRLPTHYTQDCTGDLLNFVNTELRDTPCQNLPSNAHGLNSQITQTCIDTERPIWTPCNPGSWDPLSTDYIHWVWNTNTDDACYHACDFWYETNGLWCRQIFECDRDLDPTYKLNINNNDPVNGYYLEFLRSPIADRVSNYSVDTNYEYINSFTELVQWNYDYDLVLNNVLQSGPDVLDIYDDKKSYEWNFSMFYLDESQYEMDFTISKDSHSFTEICTVNPCP